MKNENRTEFRQLEIAPVLGAIERLQHDRGYRDLCRLFFIEGVRNFIAAVDHGFSVDTLLYSEKLLIHPLARTNFEQLRRWSRMNKIEVIGASPDGSQDYRQVNYTRPAVLMLGSERKGLTDEQRGLCNRIVRIPMVEGTDSLNLAVAGSFVMYEVFQS